MPAASFVSDGAHGAGAPGPGRRSLASWCRQVRPRHRFRERSFPTLARAAPVDRHRDQPGAVGAHQLRIGREPGRLDPEAVHHRRRGRHPRRPEHLRRFDRGPFQYVVRLRCGVDVPIARATSPPARRAWTLHCGIELLPVDVAVAMLPGATSKKPAMAARASGRHTVAGRGFVRRPPLARRADPEHPHTHRQGAQHHEPRRSTRAPAESAWGLGTPCDAYHAVGPYTPAWMATQRARSR